MVTYNSRVYNVRRQYLYQDVIELYESDSTLMNNFTPQMNFVGERAVDAGGVSRDMFSGFWEVAYLQIFDGGCSLIPAVHPQVDMTKFPILGMVLSHGYLTCGFLPLRIAFPAIASCLLGPTVRIPDEILLESFLDYLVHYEMKTVKDALCAFSTGQFPPNLISKLTTLLSRYGCRSLPKPESVKRLILEVARHEFMIKAAGATCAMHAGVPEEHKSFWSKYSVEELYGIYKSLNGSPDKVIERILEPPEMSANEERVFGYFMQFIGSLDLDELRLFMRFITGSSVMLNTGIRVIFNGSTGAARLPIAHTCSPAIELPSTYATYPDFAHDFKCVLKSEYGWLMDAV